MKLIPIPMGYVVGLMMWNDRNHCASQRASDAIEKHLDQGWFRAMSIAELWYLVPLWEAVLRSAFEGVDITF